ncbi:uncharacterized protein LOC115927695 [Strongylocentrotus purpuratus]|uniref:Mutator-like transposase domain-containing protein n=1 Tax=Strongylocentrotus purpuratus TaxID=7668 RepID=A0A7M7T2U8_STRPU|nr:uncharacterized protein LOC115927695 [Strongylocentrotus purpuratus]
MVLGCFICKKERTFSSSENECEGRGKSAEINRRATLAATEVGLARNSLCDLLTILETAPLVEAPSYNRHIATLSSLSQETSKNQKKKVAACLRQRAMDKDLTIRENDHVDVAVPYDGTWGGGSDTDRYRGDCLTQKVYQNHVNSLSIERVGSSVFSARGTLIAFRDSKNEQQGLYFLLLFELTYTTSLT